ncbi:MAG TPA: YihY/virulence factor BrkB family protein [Gaiellales bacterium]|nr:YihY/virulence factor BrkB family protein [Gaiellales bacterium]
MEEPAPTHPAAPPHLPSARPEGRLRARDAGGIAYRALRRAHSDHALNLAQAVAFNLFLALPAAALVIVGVFANVAGPGTAGRLLTHLNTIVPQSVIRLVDHSLTQVTSRNGGGTAMIVVGLVLALWSLIGAMQTLQWALNVAHDLDEKRGFVHTRLAAVAMLACFAVAFVLAFGLLVLGPQASHWAGDAIDQPTVVSWIWWTAEWPVLIVVLLLAFGGIYRFGPDMQGCRWRVVSAGTVTAVAVWLAASGGFAWYVSNLGSYNKSWGSFAAVIVMLTWLWLSSLALLVGAAIDAEVARTRRRRG